MKLEVRNLTKKYLSGSSDALKNVSLTFESGNIYGLLGRNGAGKSTLLNIITQKIGRTSGEVLLDGEELKKDSQLQQIYMMSDQNYMYSDMKIIKLYRMLQKVYPNFDMPKCERLVKEFDLNTGKHWTKLSTGYRTIFKLIAALCVNVPFVIFDEPILGLDAVHRDIFYREVLRLFTDDPEICIVISTHLIEEISHLINRVIIIDEGNVKLVDDMDNLSQNALCITGRPENVRNATEGMRRIAYREIGNDAMFYGFGTPQDEDVKIESIELQKLFILLTNGGRA